MICEKCGKELSENAVFCTGCGTKVVKDEQVELESNPVPTSNVDYVGLATNGLNNTIGLVKEFIKDPYAVARKSLSNKSLDWWVLLLASILVFSVVFPLTLQKVFTIQGYSILEYLEIDFSKLFTTHLLIALIINVGLIVVLWVLLNSIYKKNVNIHQILNYVSVISIPLIVCNIIAFVLNYVSFWAFALVLITGVLVFFAFVQDMIRGLEGSTQGALIKYMIASLTLTVATAVTFYTTYKSLFDEFLSSFMDYFM